MVRIIFSQKVTRQIPIQAWQKTAPKKKTRAILIITIVGKKIITSYLAPNFGKNLKSSFNLGNPRINDWG